MKIPDEYYSLSGHPIDIMGNKSKKIITANRKSERF